MVMICQKDTCKYGDIWYQYGVSMVIYGEIWVGRLSIGFFFGGF